MTKSPFAVAEGVAWVNGALVPADRVVHLTEAEAVFDLGLGRIAPTPGGEATEINPPVVTDDDEV